ADATALGAAPFVGEALRWLPGGDGVEAEPVADGLLPVAIDPLTQAAGPTSRVLLADDNADVRVYVTRLLRQQGWTVEAVPDGAAALAAARARRPDLVLSDVMMPGLDGFALLRALRADEATATVPVILLSARAGEEARVEGAHRGADDYLAKPFSARELVARVGAHLALARERDRVAAATAAARDLLMRVLDQAPAAICVLRGPTHVFELANAFYRRITGGRPLVGRAIAEAIPEVGPQGFLELLDRVYRTGEAYVGRALPLVYDRAGNGTPTGAWFNFVYHPFIEPDGSISGVIAVATEVTDQVLARRESEAARREAEEARETAEAANRAKSQFLAVMSHELRTPLNAIAGHVQLLEMEIHGPVTAAQSDALGRIGRNQRHLLGLINDVLNLSRIETGRVEYEIEEFRLDEAVHALGAMIEPQLAAKGLVYEVRLPTRPVRVRADREKLAQVLLNLLSNAVKFTPPGGRVSLEAEAPDGVPVAHVRVRDTGVGIPADKLQTIFEPFVQVRSDLTRTSEGAGLGLAISRDLSRGMGAELSAASVPGQGSIFTLALPAAVD
ncbi:MAG TPA: response regulator, partial [Longimicrobium sp.]|nr:response regulator [Longimicrobium sp.]